MRIVPDDGRAAADCGAPVTPQEIRRTSDLHLVPPIGVGTCPIIGLDKAAIIGLDKAAISTGCTASEIVQASGCGNVIGDDKQPASAGEPICAGFGGSRGKRALPVRFLAWARDQHLGR